VRGAADPNPRQGPAGPNGSVRSDSTQSDLEVPHAAPPTTRGAGQTVAIVAAFDHPDAESDLAHDRGFFGLPACTSANGCFRKVNQRGGSAPPRADAGWGHDVTSGANGSCGGSYLCTAMRGYDGPSGLGTPNGIGAF
jgi:hypothetical protein